MCEDRFDIHIYPSLESHPPFCMLDHPFPETVLSLPSQKIVGRLPGNLTEKRLIRLPTFPFFF